MSVAERGQQRDSLRGFSPLIVIDTAGNHDRAAKQTSHKLLVHCGSAPYPAGADCAPLKSHAPAGIGWLGVRDDAPVVLFVRPLPGVVGERRRQVHIVPVPDANAIPEMLTAYCGQQFAPGTAELLSEPRGMPCVWCLAKAPIPGTDQLPDARR